MRVLRIERLGMKIGRGQARRSRGEYARASRARMLGTCRPAVHLIILLLFGYLITLSQTGKSTWASSGRLRSCSTRWGTYTKSRSRTVFEQRGGGRACLPSPPSPRRLSPASTNSANVRPTYPCPLLPTPHARTNLRTRAWTRSGGGRGVEAGRSEGEQRCRSSSPGAHSPVGSSHEVGNGMRKAGGCMW